jgi:hypothetical protein
MADDEPGYRKIGNRVLLRGKISGGTDQLAFTLPEGIRPLSDSHFQVDTGRGTSVVTVQADGSVLADPNDGWISLDRINFPVD